MIRSVPFFFCSKTYAKISSRDTTSKFNRIIQVNDEFIVPYFFFHTAAPQSRCFLGHSVASVNKKTKVIQNGPLLRAPVFQSEKNQPSWNPLWTSVWTQVILIATQGTTALHDGHAHLQRKGALLGLVGGTNFAVCFSQRKHLQRFIVRGTKNEQDFEWNRMVNIFRHKGSKW